MSRRTDENLDISHNVMVDLRTFWMPCQLLQALTFRIGPSFVD